MLENLDMEAGIPKVKERGTDSPPAQTQTSTNAALEWQTAWDTIQT